MLSNKKLKMDALKAARLLAWRYEYEKTTQLDIYGRNDPSSLPGGPSAIPYVR